MRCPVDGFLLVNPRSGSGSASPEELVTRAHALGINDLQFGIVVIVNLTMGMITPPVGGLLFVTAVVARVPLPRMVAELWPFMWAQIAVLGMLSLFLAISTLLPNLSGYR